MNTTIKSQTIGYSATNDYRQVYTVQREGNVYGTYDTSAQAFRALLWVNTEFNVQCEVVLVYIAE